MLGIDMGALTSTERQIIDLLLDGHVHTCEEILLVCFDELSAPSNLYPHISNLRKKISDKGLLLSFVIANGRRDKGYQLSRRLCSAV